MEIKYKTQFGTIDELINGKGLEIQSEKDISKLTYDYGALVLPKALGVYQVNSSPPVPSMMMDGLDMVLFEMDSQEIIKEVYDREDKIHSDLITIAYDSSFMNPDIVNLLGLNGDFLRRVNTCSINKLPNYALKKLAEEKSFVDVFTKLEKEINRDSIKELKNYFELFKTNRSEYGLTRNEAAQLVAVKETLEDIECPAKKLISRICDLKKL